MTTEWPPLPDGWQNDKAMQKLRAEKVIGAEIELEQGRRAAVPASNPTSTMSFALEQKLHETLYTVATGSIDRARSGAQFVQTAASAIGVLYTGVLAVIFVSDTPVPARGFIPTLFLAASIGLATAYLAFVNKMDAIDRPTLYGSLAEDIWQRTNFLSRYARAIVLQRAPLLRAAAGRLYRVREQPNGRGDSRTSGQRKVLPGRLRPAGLLLGRELGRVQVRRHGNQSARRYCRSDD